MNLLKSIYVSAFITAALVASGWAAAQLLSAGTLTSPWLGALIACLPVAGFFAMLLVRPTARTSPNLQWMLALGAVGTLVAGVLAGAVNHPAVWTALGVGVIGTLVYVYWYSRFANRDTATLRNGWPVPAFSLEDETGNPIHVSDLTGRPALWIFYRGNWCPLCMAQVREVAAQYRDIAERGADVMLVSPQSAGHTQSLAAKFDVPMRFLRDPDNQAARVLGILAQDGLPTGLQVFGYDSDVPMPTVFITDTQGQVVYCDLTDNYRVRPEPAEFIAVLDRLGITA